MQIENAVCVFYLINTPFASHYPHPGFVYNGAGMQWKIALQWNEKPPQFPFKQKYFECWACELNSGAFPGQTN